MKDKLKDKMKKKFTDLSISHKMLMVYITFASAFLLIALGLTQISFRIYSKELYDKSLQELDYFSQNVNRGLKDAERNNYSISMDALVQRTLSDLSVLEYPSLDYNQKIRDLRRILLNEYDPESCVKSIIFVDLYGNTVEVGTAAWDVSGESFTAIKKQMEQGKGAYTTYGPTEECPYLLSGRVVRNRLDMSLSDMGMVSTDNCSHNGDKLYAAIDEFAKAWSKNGVAEAGFADYVNSDKVSFTWSMIDKITPRPDANVEKMLLDDGVEGLDPVITSKNTYVAPFVNAEETEYLVIEDKFPNGREALEAGGLMFTDRETVDKVEKMKVCTCLNPLHTALAIYGCLLGYDKISEEMKDDDLRKMIEIIGYKEGLPVVVNPGILDPKKFIKTVLEVRLPNPFMPDTPQRIATDTSQKLAIRFGETIKAYMASDELEASDLKLIPLVFAGWLRYLMAVDDNGNAFEPSSDPMLAELTPYLKDIKWNDEQAEKKILPILAKSEIFGVNLAEAGLLCRVVKYFKELIAGVGAVRTTLHKYVSNN